MNKSELKSYLKELGSVIKHEREKRKMSQIAFYKFLYPETDKDELNIKKKMNSLEHGKQLTVDYDLLITIHSKCDISMDFLFGFETEYPNYENKNASMYTGLSSNTIKKLHTISTLESYKTEDKETKRQYDNDHINVDRMKEAEWVLKTIDLLFDNSSVVKRDGFSNLDVLFDIYMLSLTSPESLWGLRVGSVSTDDTFVELIQKTEELYIDSLIMNDTLGGTHDIDFNKIYKQIWKNELNKDLDFLAENTNKLNKEKTIPEHKDFDFSKLEGIYSNK